MGLLVKLSEVWSDYAVQSAKSWEPRKREASAVGAAAPFFGRDCGFNAVLFCQKTLLTDSPFAAHDLDTKRWAGRKSVKLHFCAMFFFVLKLEFLWPCYKTYWLPDGHTLMTSPVTRHRVSAWRLKLHCSTASLDENWVQTEPSSVVPVYFIN